MGRRPCAAATNPPAVAIRARETNKEKQESKTSQVLMHIAFTLKCQHFPEGVLKKPRIVDFVLIFRKVSSASLNTLFGQIRAVILTHA